MKDKSDVIDDIGIIYDYTNKERMERKAQIERETAGEHSGVAFSDYEQNDLTQFKDGEVRGMNHDFRESQREYDREHNH